MKKKVTRKYSRDFTPGGEGRGFTISRIPIGFWSQVQAKAKREGVSLRSLILGFLQEWLGGPAVPEDSFDLRIRRLDPEHRSAVLFALDVAELRQKGTTSTEDLDRAAVASFSRSLEGGK